MKGHATKFRNGDDVCRYVRERSGSTTMLGWSGGKDSIAAYMKLREYFDRIVLVHMWTIPNLEFVEEKLREHEQALGCQILRMPAPGFFRWLRDSTFMDPDHMGWFSACEIPKFTYEDVLEEARKIAKAPGAWNATGIRAADGPVRRRAMTVHGPVTEGQRLFHPVYDWNIEDVRDAVHRSGLTLPVDYELFGRTFEGIDYRFVKPISERFPRDFERILEWFPFVRFELLRREFYHGKRRRKQAE